MEEELENETPTNEEEQQPNAETPDVSEITEKLTKAEETAKNQKIRAEKAERELKELKAKETETPKNEEPEYSKLAFLEGRKVTHPDDQKFVMDEAKRLKLPLTDILGMEYIKSKLKDFNDQREASEGMPKGKGKSKGANPQDVEYHLAKGTTPEDVELANKVIEARMKKEVNANKFSEELYTG